jgi:hypothetical protein
MLGHADSRTTETYLGNRTADELRAALQGFTFRALAEGAFLNHPKCPRKPSRGAYRNRTGGGPAWFSRAKKSTSMRLISWRLPSATAPRSGSTEQGGAAAWCRHCGRRIPPPLRRCRRRTCPGYAALWAGDQRQKLFANLNAYADHVPSGVRSPRVLVGAVTAPGVSGGWNGRPTVGT